MLDVKVSELGKLIKESAYGEKLFYVLVTERLVEGVIPDLQHIAVSQFPCVYTTIPALNLSTAILFIVSHLEIFI